MKLPPPKVWPVGISDEFIKTTQRLDKKLQGRIFEAIIEISKSPTTIKGNTVMPLRFNSEGLWRYRIGGYRLIYYPDKDNKRIVLVTFGGRGSVYEG